jgi:TPP-dependent pyruvate/acetoin dehydrogenase alpha subunit
MPEHVEILKAYDCPILIQQKTEGKDSVQIGTNYKHQKAKDYLTQQHRNSKHSIK